MKLLLRSDCFEKQNNNNNRHFKEPAHPTTPPHNAHFTLIPIPTPILISTYSSHLLTFYLPTHPSQNPQTQPKHTHTATIHLSVHLLSYQPTHIRGSLPNTHRDTQPVGYSFPTSYRRIRRYYHAFQFIITDNSQLQSQYPLVEFARCVQSDLILISNTQRRHNYIAATQTDLRGRPSLYYLPSISLKPVELREFVDGMAG